jgi:phospholipid N-methyltransferase
MVRRMLDPIDWKTIKLLVEYGPGTGRFTKAALDRMSSGTYLIAIETGEEFVKQLKSIDDTRLRVVEGSATDVLQILTDHGLGQADCIISGVPFSTLAREEADHLVRLTRAVLSDTGIFAAYQMRTSIEPLLRKQFGKVSKSYEWWNIPPCHLYWAHGRPTVS